MARIAGADLPDNKRVEIALTYIYGVGRSRAKEILTATGVSPDKRVRELTEDEIAELRREIEGNYMVEGDLRRRVRGDIQRLKDINCYRGIRHKVGLPVRGQKTRSNARSWKGSRASKSGKRR
ncbi:MAG: 30S ribosomal protein S13 [Candidatus Bipolaricaulia bacterium]